MYFPSDMDFQYFFFDTYLGYFLEALPIALIAAAAWFFLRFRKDKETPLAQKIMSSALIGYLTGLICLVVLLDAMQLLWYAIFYHRASGIRVDWFGGEFSFLPDFWNRINGESIGNFLLFLPFGVLYPLSHPKASFRKTVLAGTLCVFAIELLQPIFGRAFDINDIILNVSGVIVSAAVVFLVRAGSPRGQAGK